MNMSATLPALPAACIGGYSRRDDARELKPELRNRVNASASPDLGGPLLPPTGMCGGAPPSVAAPLGRLQLTAFRG
jgi:hypothetical protein